MSATLSASAGEIAARLNERARLLEQLIADGQVRGENENAGAEVTDQKDGANDEARAEIDSAAVARHLAELRQIDQARARLAAGTYGQCVSCGETIAPARLLAQPTAARCTACQAAFERRA